MSPFGTTTTHTYKLLPSPAAATASLLHLAGFRTLETAGLAIAIVRSHDRAFRHTDFAMPVLGIQIIRTYRTSTQGRLSGGLSATRVQHESVHHRGLDHAHSLCFALAFRCAHRGTQLSTGWVEEEALARR